MDARYWSRMVFSNSSRTPPHVEALSYYQYLIFFHVSSVSGPAIGGLKLTHQTFSALTIFLKEKELTRDQLIRLKTHFT